MTRYDTVVDKVKKFEVAQNFRRGVYVTPYGNKVMRLQCDAATFTVRVCLRALMHTIPYRHLVFTIADFLRVPTSNGVKLNGMYLDRIGSATNSIIIRLSAGTVIFKAVRQIF